MNLCPFIDHFDKAKLKIVLSILLGVNLYVEMCLKLPKTYGGFVQSLSARKFGIRVDKSVKTDEI